MGSAVSGPTGELDRGSVSWRSVRGQLGGQCSQFASWIVGKGQCQLEVSQEAVG